MTAQTRAVNKSVFEEGDTPQGSDYANLIDSFLSLVDTSAQAIQSDLSVASLTVGGALNCTSLTVQSMICSSLAVLTPISFVGQVSAASMATERFVCGGTVATSVMQVAATAQVFRLNVSSQISWGSVASCQLNTNGTAQMVGFRLLAAPITSYTSVQTSAFWLNGGDLGTVKFFRIVVNGSVYSIPMFRGSIAS